MKRGRYKRHDDGFTLVEMLTTLAVIGVLLALLVPALNQVTKAAANVKQRAQFHAIGTALESFRNDYGDYPPSRWNEAVYGKYSASHRLAEALIGRDGLGFHPKSQFRSDGLADMDGDGTIDNQVYHANTDYAYETASDNLAARKGPYMEIESANAVKLNNINVLTSSLYQDAYVLVDMYKIVRNNATGKDVGMPILYYKANRMKIGNDPDPSPPNTNWINNTYSLNDSFCDGLGFIEKNWRYDTFSNDLTYNAELFYDNIQNPNFTSPPRPYRAESFLLHSAGPDGIYGTSDDVFNFDQDN